MWDNLLSINPGPVGRSQISNYNFPVYNPERSMKPGDSQSKCIKGRHINIRQDGLSFYRPAKGKLDTFCQMNYLGTVDKVQRNAGDCPVYHCFSAGYFRYLSCCN